jgi:hypothetical protein
MNPEGQISLEEVSAEEEEAPEAGEILKTNSVFAEVNNSRSRFPG